MINTLILEHQEIGDVGGGTQLANVWQQRPLNTIVLNNIPESYLINNDIYLPSGKYTIKAEACSVQTGGNSLRLANTEPTPIVYAQSTNNWNPYITTHASNTVTLENYILLSDLSILQLQHYANYQFDTYGMGKAYAASQSDYAVFTRFIATRVGDA